RIINFYKKNINFCKKKLSLAATISHLHFKLHSILDLIDMNPKGKNKIIIIYSSSPIYINSPKLYYLAMIVVFVKNFPLKFNPDERGVGIC
ncbi:hypothetical protein ACJX0J_034055, partial [Zea mays]